MSRRACLIMTCGGATLAAFALLACAHPAVAAVTWNFIETSLTLDSTGLSEPDFVPRIAGSLTVSNSDLLAGGISYSFSQGPDGSTVGGNQDFLLVGFGEILPRGPDPLIDDHDASADLTFSAGGDLSGFVQDDLELSDLRMSIADNNVGSGEGTIATDDDALGCPISVCDFTGFWTLVPEPGSSLVLTIALALTGLLRLADPSRARFAVSER